VVNNTVLVFNELCHSCEGCMEVCPENAITEKGRELGIIQKGHHNGIEFIHGKLRVGEAMSPPLIKVEKEIFGTLYEDKKYSEITGGNLNERIEYN